MKELLKLDSVAEVGEWDFDPRHGGRSSQGVVAAWQLVASIAASDRVR